MTAGSLHAESSRRVRILNRAEVESLLDFDELLAALAQAHRDLSLNPTSVPPKIGVFAEEERGYLVAMPAFVPSQQLLGAKLMCGFRDNPSRGLPFAVGLVVLFSAVDGLPLAVLDASYITEVRTAAMSALATRTLAARDASVLAILGTGVQAHAHAVLISRVCHLGEIRIAGRSLRKAEDLAGRLERELGVPCRGSASYREAMDGAEIVCGTTHTVEPVIRREYVAPGMHINSVGLNRSGREVDAETVRDSLVVVESRAHVLAEGTAAGLNDLLWPIRDGVITREHIKVELGELLDGRAQGRTAEDQITLYKSVGLGVQDVTAAALVARRATELGRGQLIAI